MPITVRGRVTVATRTRSRRYERKVLHGVLIALEDRTGLSARPLNRHKLSLRRSAPYGEQVEELIGAASGRSSTVRLRDIRAEGYLLGGQLLCVADQFIGPAPLLMRSVSA